ncbi:hypothetical protein J008_00017 [Cryptococcus neoformans]|nr:hypothetical protein J008_00017 [Cryptococcus neoformans var. grubii]
MVWERKRGVWIHCSRSSRSRIGNSISPSGKVNCLHRPPLTIPCHPIMTETKTRRLYLSIIPILWAAQPTIRSHLSPGL